jgi:hypothetical protein
LVKKIVAGYLHLKNEVNSFNTDIIMKNVIFKYLVPLIMLFFFARNIVLVETENLDSWMGGGMRMFGKIDKMLYRVSGFNVEHNNKTYFVNLKNIKYFEDEDVENRILPSKERLNQTLKKIKTLSWCYNKELDAIELKNNNECHDAIDSKNIKELKVYQINYNPESKIVKLKQLGDAKNK